MESPEPFPPPEHDEPYLESEQEGIIRPAGGFWALGGRLTWVAGLVLAVSAFTGWYSGLGRRAYDLRVIGWHTGTLGKLVFFIGLAVSCSSSSCARSASSCRPTVPESLVVIGLGVAGDDLRPHPR